MEEAMKIVWKSAIKSIHFLIAEIFYEGGNGEMRGTCNKWMWWRTIWSIVNDWIFASYMHIQCTYSFRNYLYQSESQLILNLRLLFINRNNKRKVFYFSPHLMCLCMHIQSRYLSQAVNSGKDFQDFSTPSEWRVFIFNYDMILLIEMCMPCRQ